MGKVTRRRLKEVLNYDPLSGKFTWIKTIGKRIHVGMVAGSRNTNGHVQIKIDGRAYLATHLAVLWMTGRWPKKQVDHEDLDPANDRWSNLRQATNAENCRNQRRFRNNTTGFKGVSFHKQKRKFCAYITKNYRRVHLGSFGDAASAHAAYKAAAVELFGKFARFT